MTRTLTESWIRTEIGNSTDVEIEGSVPSELIRTLVTLHSRVGMESNPESGNPEQSHRSFSEAMSMMSALAEWSKGLYVFGVVNTCSTDVVTEDVCYCVCAPQNLFMALSKANTSSWNTVQKVSTRNAECLVSTLSKPLSEGRIDFSLDAASTGDYGGRSTVLEV
ncbi:hypothetical protein EVAR_92452_1 [Eumeta japonica]|uniref:Uncharacterized protein n=1 Tax=Eumeta variegata TaxID=151549 RepID=A0A4C1T8T1_EUMVA|nr:hypothetical protein EVAR_92452_1 [Eumeta japonica]